uniref:Polyprotein n=2 Tax=Oryza sativa subsp. japonica TaxID=39947 RepID=A0A5S6RCD2_ORYSJ|nr:Putative polyprotein [Oryza sativa Japonica Group]AAP52155.1 transposon protein, putative, unclassified [Oryza sativa Japonica Group]
MRDPPVSGTGRTEEASARGPTGQRHGEGGLPWTGTTQVIHRRSTGLTARIALGPIGRTAAAAAPGLGSASKPIGRPGASGGGSPSDGRHRTTRGSLGGDVVEGGRHQGGIRRCCCHHVTTGNNPTGIPYVRALFLVPGGKIEPQTKPYPLDIWKYGSALQQRPEDRSLYGRGATIKTRHPKPSLKPFYGY